MKLWVVERRSEVEAGVEGKIRRNCNVEDVYVYFRFLIVIILVVMDFVTG